MSCNILRLYFKDRKGSSTPLVTTTHVSLSSKPNRNSKTSKIYQPSENEMKRVFDQFDKNKDGKIPLEEYELATKVLGKTNSKKEILEAFQALDTNKDGFIDFEEILKSHSTGGGLKVDDIESVFRMFDADSDGKINAEEWFQVLKKIGENCSLEACRKLMIRVDSDGDGLIDINEFMQLMTSKSADRDM